MKIKTDIKQELSKKEEEEAIKQNNRDLELNKIDYLTMKLIGIYKQLRLEWVPLRRRVFHEDMAKILKGRKSSFCENCK